MMQHKRLKVVSLTTVLLGFLLVACGGSTPNQAPVADAGADQAVAVGTEVSVSGNASTDADGDTLTFAWTLDTVPDGSGATLSAADSAQAAFTPDVEGDYTLTLTVSDGQDSDSDTVTITATVQPTEAEFGGVTEIRRDAANDTAEADLSVSAFDAEDSVLTSGTVENPVVDETSLTVSGLAGQQYTPTSVSAQVCGNITAPQGGPVTAAITLDGSGSMSGTDPSQLRNDAAKAFIARLGGSDQAAVGWFTSGSGTAPYDVLRVEQDFTSDQQLLDEAVDRATVAQSGTPLWDASVDTVALLDSVSATNKIAIILTDGGDTGSASSVQNVIDAANANNTRIYTVGLTAATDPNLSRLASDTGGTFQAVVEADDLVGSFSGIFGATQASGCITTIFSPLPPSNTLIEGTINFQVNGTPLSTGFRVRF